MAIFRRRADSGEVTEQIARLGRQIEQLMNQRVTPALAGAVQRAGTAAETASSQVRGQPLLSILIAVVSRFLVARLFR